MALEWTVGALSILVTVLMGWQIYNVIAIDKIVRKAVQRTIEKISPALVGEATGTAFYNMGEQAYRMNDKANALALYIKAAHNLQNAVGHEVEIECCLDCIESILQEFGKKNNAVGLPLYAGVAYLNMLYTLKADRAKKIAQKYFEELQCHAR